MPSLSILTSTWNRAGYLARVHSALRAQTCGDFEWIVADDGSVDETSDVVRALAEHSRFPVLYLKAEAHVGKARMDNEAIRRARGELVVWCDSDDMLAPDAVESFLATWQAIPDAERRQFVGVIALAATEQGILANPFPEDRPRDISWNDLTGLYELTTDMTYMVRTDLLRANPFPEVDLVVPESAVWNAIGHNNSRFVPKVLLIKEYRAANAISFSGKMDYNRGRAHAAAIVQRELRAYDRPWRARAWQIVTFLRYCIHGEIGFRDARRLWGGNSSGVALLAATPLAFALAAVDRLRNKVVKSHREFLANRGSAVKATWLSAEPAP